MKWLHLQFIMELSSLFCHVISKNVENADNSHLNRN